MKMLWLMVVATISPIYGFCADQSRVAAETNTIVFRQPFTLKLHVDKEHYYEEAFGRIPYVFKDDVYLFKDDVFGIDLDITNGLIRSIAYQPDTNRATVILRFTQEVREDGDAMMLLEIRNRSDWKLFIDALMTVPGKKSARKTSIVPLGPGLVGYESWPHPIVQLVLRNIHLKEKNGTEPGGPTNGSPPARPHTNPEPPAAGSGRSP
jgi:hypothetical protein